MDVGISLSATLQQIVRSTLANLPGSERGSMMVRDGQHLSYRAAVGYDLERLRSWQLPYSGQSEPMLDVAVHPATEWYTTHMPPELRSSVQPPADATIVAVPIVRGGQLMGVLNVERTAATCLTAEQHVVLQLLAEKTALVLERHWLFGELTRSTEEGRLLADVLDAVGSSSKLEEVIHTVGYGIKNALPYKRWHTVRLALLAARQQQLHTYEILGRRMNPFWSNINKGALTAGRDLGVEVEFVLGGDSGEDSQVQAIDAGIRAGVHGIAVAAVNPVAVEAAIRRAREAGIPVVAYDVPPVADSQALVYIGTDNMSTGRLAGEMLAQLLPGGGVIGVGTESLQQINAQQRLAGFQAATADIPIELLPPCVDNHDVALGQRLASKTLEEHPDLAGVFGITAAATPNWGAAIKAAGRAGQIKVVGFDMVADTISMLKEGLVDVAIAQREYNMGYRSVQVLSEMIVNGVEQTLAQLPDSRFIDTGVDAVTLEGTPWSMSLAEYLNSLSNRQSSSREQHDAVAHYGKPIKLLVIAISEKAELSTGEQDVPFQSNSFARQVITNGQSLIIDPFAPEYANFPEAIGARERNIRTIVGVPLTDRGTVVGLMSLESQMADACTPVDLALIERIANAGAVVIANARLFDQVAERTGELERAYQRHELMLQTINELSSPVAAIIPGILVMPLIGSIDSQRAGRFLETLLHEISARQAQVVLIDITGVSVVDTGVANHIQQAAQAAKLLGAEAVLVGITPVVAQTMVQLGVDMQRLVTRSDLASGFAYALERMRARIVYN